MTWTVKEALHHFHTQNFTSTLPHSLFSWRLLNTFPIFLTYNSIFTGVWMTWQQWVHGNLTSGARAVKIKPMWKQLSSDFQCQIIFISMSSWMVNIRSRSVYELVEENQKGKTSHLFPGEQTPQPPKESTHYMHGKAFLRIPYSLNVRLGNENPRVVF